VIWEPMRHLATMRWVERTGNNRLYRVYLNELVPSIPAGARRGARFGTAKHRQGDFRFSGGAGIPLTCNMEVRGEGMCRDRKGGRLGEGPRGACRKEFNSGAIRFGGLGGATAGDWGVRFVHTGKRFLLFRAHLVWVLKIVLFFPFFNF